MAETKRPSGASAREYLSAREVRDWLGVPEKTLYRWKDQRIIPHVKLVGKVLFPKAALDQLLKDGFVDAIGNHHE